MVDVCAHVYNALACSIDRDCACICSACARAVNDYILEVAISCRIIMLTSFVNGYTFNYIFLCKRVITLGDSGVRK